MKLAVKEREFVTTTMKHITSLYNYALCLTKNESKAKELLKKTYALASNQFGDFRDKTNIRLRLFRIMKDCNYYHNHNGVKVVESGVSFRYDFDPNDIRLVLERNLTKDDLWWLLQNLPENFRTVIYLKDVEGFSYEEVSEFFNVSIGTVRSLIHNARRALGLKLVQFAKEVEAETVG